MTEAAAETFDAFARRVSPLQPYSDFSDWEQETYRASYVNLIGGAEAVVSLIRAVEHVLRNGIPGALVECGVYMGGNIEVMIRTLNRHGVKDRDIYLYDTFEGMPEPEPADDEGLPGNPCAATWREHRNPAVGSAGSNWMRAGLDIVKARLEPLSYPAERLHFVKGMVEETIPGTMPERIALLRLDTDFYSSTRHELVHLYPRLSRGGILINDDYGAMPGSRKATDEYIAEHKLGLFLSRVDAHVRLAVKP
jgi:hypothetical protein